ncbi:hypothetical protein A1A1_16735 [Planococcus antarcticus DSM 14505]|uniref:Uncharacterized protein n=1 Tax=Planococcus antarcticus DSM 14505 TaxID=1185653 RepID=A0AA87IJ37_9BACL|nr:hypothetical protein [Planococcus antarcticus]EIM05329.1 hypothetical protein A1A1_16735 [Planococcus antarcticus DSM 14505]
MDLYVEKFGNSLSGDFSKDGEKYVFEMGAVPNIGYKDAISVNESGKKVDLKMVALQSITFKGNRGSRIIAVPIVGQQQEVKMAAEVYKDGETFIVRVMEGFSVRDKDGNVVQLAMDPFEVKAKQIKGDK